MIRKLILFFLLILLLCGAVIWFLQPQKQPEKQLPTVVRVVELPREVLLYFADPGGRYLVSESQQIDGCEDDLACVKNLFSALVAGPKGDFLPLLPAGTKVLDVELRNDLALVDFNSVFVHSHPGGSLSELLTVYAMVNSLSVNFPYLKQLQILVEGKPVPTLKGHVSLARPIMADFSYSRPPLGTAEKKAANE